MNRFKVRQRLTAVALAAATLFPLSASAETRRPAGTAAGTRIARDVLGAILGGRTASQPARESAFRRPAAARPASYGSISRESILAEMNDERRSRGLAPLRLDARLNAAAEDRARDMFSKRYFDHVAPDGTKPFVWVKRENYRYSVVGENLAQGFRTAAATVDGWMRSPGHRANLLGRSFEDTGVAIFRGSPDGTTNGYTVVAIYGSESRGAAKLARR